MAVESGVSPALAIRSSVGIELWASAGPRLPYEHKSNLPREETKNSRSISFSSDGRFFAYSNGQEIIVVETNGWKLHCTLPRPKAFYLRFSPRGSYLCTWEHYVVTKDKPEGGPNMFVYELTNGTEVFSIVQKNQSDWEPSWSSDETIFAMVVGGEALFYDLTEGVEGFKVTTRKIGGSRGGTLSLSPGISPPYVAFHTPGAKGAPSMCKLYKYPALGQNQTVACKSFYQADRVEMLWNKRGSGLLLLTSTEVDKSGASYYGNQALHFMSTKGDTCSVPLSKDGPVHCVKWSPKSNEFVVVYGFMPSKAALYNLKCDVVFDFGEGPRNCAYFNPFGNHLLPSALVVLAGFGNLPGNVEIWDVVKKEKLANIKCPDTTHFEWNPNGEHFITATTAPRLRIGNGFKVYHYSGALMHETIWPQGQELLGVEWQKFPVNAFSEPIITKAKQEGIKSSQPEASKKAYTPPHLRMMKEGKNPEGLVPQPKASIPGLSTGNSSQANLRKGGGSKPNQNNSRPNNNKHQQQKKSRQPVPDSARGDVETAGNVNASSTVAITGNGELTAAMGVENDPQEQQQQQEHQKGQRQQQPQHNYQQQSQQQRQPNRKQYNHKNQSHQKNAVSPTIENGKVAHANESEASELSAVGAQPQTELNNNPSRAPPNPVKEKKIRSISKKLSDIKKLKARQQQGESLELNQLNKIAMERTYLTELNALKLSP